MPFRAWAGMFLMHRLDSALIEAVAERNTAEIQRLLNAGADPDSEEEGEQGLTVLMLSVYAKRRDIAQMLLEHGANPNKHTEGQWTPLIEASYQGYLEFVRLLLQYGADPSIKDLNGATAISEAVVHDEVSVLLKIWQGT